LTNDGDDNGGGGGGDDGDDGYDYDNDDDDDDDNDDDNENSDDDDHGVHLKRLHRNMILSLFSICTYVNHADPVFNRYDWWMNEYTFWI
jgi:hypothetical protein